MCYVNHMNYMIHSLTNSNHNYKLSKKTNIKRKKNPIAFPVKVI